MDKNKLHTTINSIFILAIAAFGIIYYLTNTNEHIVYVDYAKLFNGFNMTRDISAAEKQKMEIQRKTLDSLYTVLRSTNHTETDSHKNLQQEIAQKSKAYQEAQNTSYQNLNSKVWDRLNTYVNEYANHKDLKIVLGANGNGNVMFGKTDLDITDDLLRYANEKYEGNI
ncbi:OmpH family outer membrane protein [Seonamhaeicola aphaedonensis]|uniref:Outer membrane protein n=1 Tax=Seonamhaeicola aphaedonensis TaxID=1461338 RepID=A0A3D9H825_9FLAO|nr:OmpH family outer membrane protein [Seonamhaeicola aphaedonensis]RED45642.1 outer membrane protein [Seonamhaeicola aphaedonensis]